jgi:limonene-1,2-epoxide hydrolase
VTTEGRGEEIARRIRAGIDAMNRGDFEAATESMHPDIEYIAPGGQPPVRGVERMRAWMEPSAFERQRTEVLDVAVFGDRALLHSRLTARGAGSGIEMQAEAWTVFTVDDDMRVTRIEAFLPHEEAEARRAATVAEPGSPS